MAKQYISNKKPLGFITALALVIGAMLGAGIFSLPASLASFGSISIIAWLLTGFGSILLALTFADLNRMVPETGGAFLYAYKAYGDYLGFAIAVSYWVAWCLGCAGAIVAITGFLAPFWPAINDHSERFNPTTALLVKIAATWLAILINILGIRVVGISQVITNLLKIFPLVVLAGFALLKFNMANLIDYYNISPVSNGHALAGAVALTLWAFTGLEAAVVPADDIDNHQTIAKATIIGTAFVALLYVIVTIALFGFIPAPILKNSISPFNDVASTLFGSAGAYLIAACAIITILGSVNGGILILAQDAMAAARYKLMPPLFAKLNKQYNTPVRGLVVSGLLISFTLLFTINQTLLKQFNFLILISTLSLLIPYFISSTAAMILLLQDKTIHKAQFRKSFLIALLSSIYAFLALIGVGEDIFFYGCLFFFAIFWLHLLFKIYQIYALKKVPARLNAS